MRGFTRLSPGRFLRSDRIFTLVEGFDKRVHAALTRHRGPVTTVTEMHLDEGTFRRVKRCHQHCH